MSVVYAITFRLMVEKYFHDDLRAVISENNYKLVA